MKKKNKLLALTVTVILVMMAAGCKTGWEVSGGMETAVKTLEKQEQPEAAFEPVSTPAPTLEPIPAPIAESTPKSTTASTQELTAELTQEPTSELTAASTQELTAELTQEPTPELTPAPTKETEPQPEEPEKVLVKICHYVCAARFFFGPPHS